MEKILSYIPNSVLRFEVNTDERVAIQSSNNLAPVIDLKFPVSEPYARLMGRWIIECRGNVILMRETDSSVRDDCIVLSFQQQEVDVGVRYRDAGGDEASRITKVNRVDIYPREVGKIKIQTADPATTSRRPDPASERGQAGPSESSQIRQLKEELEREKAESKHLQDLLAARLDDALETMTRDRQALTSENQAKYQKILSLNEEMQRLRQDSRDVDAEIAETERSLADAQTRAQSGQDQLNSIREQVNELDAQREVSELDCDAARAQLEELRTHVHLDADTAALLEQEDRLKKGMVSRTLEEMDSELEKVEKRIAFILKYRSRFNQAVENAILTGDGTITAGEEAGGIADGDEKTTPSEDARAADGN